MPSSQVAVSKLTAGSRNSPYPHRHLRVSRSMSTAHHWPSPDAKWSGQAGAEVENEVDAALYECLRGCARYSHSGPDSVHQIFLLTNLPCFVCASEPPILESFVRLSSSQWVIGRRDDDHASASPLTDRTDIFVVLPAKVGKEGSLVDAAEELRRFDRAYA